MARPTSAAAALQPSVAVHFVRLVTDYCAAHGAPAAQLFAAGGLDPAPLEDIDARMPFASFAQLCEVAATRLGDPALGVHVGATIKPGYFGAYGYLMLTCGTLGEAVQRTERYSMLVFDACRTELAIEGDEVVRTWRSNLPGNAAPGMLQEQLDAATAIASARWYTGRDDLAPRWIRFRHAAPGDPGAYEQMFRCPLAFAQPENQYGFELRHLHLPMTQANPEVQRLMEALCERTQQRLATSIETPWLAACRKTIVDTLADGEPKLERAAAAAGLGARELRTRLAQRGLHFRELVDTLRREMAMSYLDDPDLGLADIAHLLGFAEQSVFQRAFKRWTGRTPGEHRRAGGVAALGNL